MTTQDSMITFTETSGTQEFNFEGGAICFDFVLSPEQLDEVHHELNKLISEIPSYRGQQLFDILKEKLLQRWNLTESPVHKSS